MKRLYTFIAALFIFLGFAFFLTKNASSTATTSKNKNSYNWYFTINDPPCTK